MYPFKNLIAAGTFDHLHLGHKHFLKTAFSVSDFVYCCLTDYQDYTLLSDKKLPFLIQSFSQRLKNLKSFLEKEDYLKRTKISRLTDCFGPTLEKNHYLEAILVSSVTKAGAELVNFKREKLGLKPLKIIRSETIEDDHKKPLSASSIRLGQINSRGRSFIKLLPEKTLYLPSGQRHHFKKPLGRLLQGSVNNTSWAALKASLSIKNGTPYIITVGDITSQAFLNDKIPFNLAIIDQKTRREEHLFLNRKLLSKRSVLYGYNSPGTISPSLTLALEKVFKNPEKQFVLKIEGEEDLAVLPSILLSPLNTLIFYGQPFKGIIRIMVTEKIKERAVNLLGKFCY